ncbi:hypothetical protein V8F20_005628 [Naviculisporaceae sp. PSN 640]
MKTSSIPLSGSANSHSRTNSQSFFNSKPSGTPMASPRASYSVGQPFPPSVSSPGLSRTTAQDGRTPSPNYFGLTVEPAVDPRDTSVMPHDNWSTPTSSVRSFAAAIPKQLPLDANPEFEAFRRQVDANRGRPAFNLTSSFNLSLGNPHTPSASTPSAVSRPQPPKWHPLGVGVLGLGEHLMTKDERSGQKDGDADSLRDSAYVSGDSKRSSEISLNPPSFFNMGRRESPANIQSPFGDPERARSHASLSRVEDRHPRLSLAGGRTAPPSPGPAAKQRADTVPSVLDNEGPKMMAPSQLRDLLVSGHADDILLLDLRVSPQYAQARVKGALNLCIPTTLLKRATFNLTKLQQTFQAEQDQERFANWRKTSYLVVYDGSSSNQNDAISAMNTIRKFTNEGYSGSTHILRGGFQAFAEAFPDLIDQASSSSNPNLSLGSGSGGSRPSVAPVIGGVLLPTASNQPNPFFNNIRQNQDLVDGVGQLDIGVAEGFDKTILPRWLRDAAETADHGKKVSDKFLRIEETEQARMKDAYSVSTGSAGAHDTTSKTAKVRLSGLENGVKNRYKDILPFEHARVKLQGLGAQQCDYINASHLQASRSHKRYIASQGPLPATFEDFWSVIWQQDVRVIVMLTAESEGGQLKCHPYWKGRDFGPIRLRALSEKKVSLDIDKHRSNSSLDPTSSSQTSNGTSTTSTQNYEAFNRNSQSETGRRRANTTTSLQQPAATNGAQPQQPNYASETPYVIIRKFALSHAAHPFSPIREITHLHYPSWPDFGAPAQPSHLLALVELANVMQHSSLPVDVPIALASRRGSNGSTEGQKNGVLDPMTGQRTAGNIKGGDSLSLSWYDGPETDEHPRPMLVHCSAGCGRTGAFCTVDSVIDMLKRQRLRDMKKARKRVDAHERRMARRMEEDRSRTAKRQARERPDVDGDVAMVDPLSKFEIPKLDRGDTDGSGTSDDDANKSSSSEDEKGIDTSWLDDDSVDLIARTVEDFRGQRLSMVQSLRQFVLCYETVIEWIGRMHEQGSSGAKGRMRSGSLAL